MPRLTLSFTTAMATTTPCTTYSRHGQKTILAVFPSHTAIAGSMSPKFFWTTASAAAARGGYLPLSFLASTSLRETTCASRQIRMVSSNTREERSVFDQPWISPKSKPSSTIHLLSTWPPYYICYSFEVERDPRSLSLAQEFGQQRREITLQLQQTSRGTAQEFGQGRSTLP